MLFDEYRVRYHQEKLLKEAERSRLIAQARQRPVGPKFSYGLAVARLGGQLCQWGGQLQERFGEVETATYVSG